MTSSAGPRNDDDARESAADPEPIIWMRPEATGRGRAPALSRDQIARAAVRIADADGLEAVSMRRVASEIGAGTMSLYRYVRDKDELYALMVEVALTDTLEQRRHAADAAATAAEPGAWTDVLRELGRTTRQMVLAHPWFPVVQAGIIAPGPAMARGLEEMMTALDGLGIGTDVDEMLEVIRTVMSFALGAAQDETVAARVMLRSGLTSEQWQTRQAPYIWSLIETGDFPYLRRVVVDARGPHRDPGANFERALDRLITGIAATVPARPDRSGHQR